MRFIHNEIVDSGIILRSCCNRKNSVLYEIQQTLYDEGYFVKPLRTQHSIVPGLLPSHLCWRTGGRSCGW